MPRPPALPRSVRPGDGVLTPWVPLCIALLVVNDHLLKESFPGMVTGKLSDLGGLAFFPVLLATAVELATGAVVRPRAAAALVLLTGLVFAATKTLPAAAASYGHAIGLLQWPLRALWHGGAPFAAAPVVVDPTDLLALPAQWLPWVLLRRRARLSAAPLST